MNCTKPEWEKPALKSWQQQFHASVQAMVKHFQDVTVFRIGCKLGECRIILCEAGIRHRLQKLQLNFPSDDVSFALKDSKDLPWLVKYL